MTNEVDVVVEHEASEDVSPVCFIEHVNDEFRVTDDAKEMLSSVKGKVVIVCVAGPYRTGKSFLLNKLVGNSKGFKVGATIRACTKGIWLWGKPIKKGEISYLFLDTEGLGSTEQALPYDTKIFSLAVLLSSFFILNTQGTINEQALNELELVVNCANQVRMYDKAEQQEGEEEIHTSEIANVFPSFLWVLRDFALRLTDEDNRPMSANDYLEACLSQKSSNRTKNRTRETIKNVFLHRDCRTLVRPILDEEQLQSLSDVPTSQLRPEFLKQLDSLSALIFASSRPKQINGGLVNGPALLGLAEAYTRAMNGGKMPVIFTAWEAVVMTQASQGVEGALSLFVSRLSELCPPQHVMEREVLEDAIQVAEKEALESLRSVCVGDEQTNRSTEITLLAKLNDYKRERVMENTNLSRAQCSQLLAELWPDEKEITDSEFMHAVAQVREEFSAKAIGLCKEEVARSFFEKKLSNFCTTLVGNLSHLTSQHNELQAKKDEIAELHAEAVKIAEEQSVISERLEGELYELRQNHAALEETSQATDIRYRQQLNALTTEMEAFEIQLQQTKIALTESEKAKQKAISKQQKLKDRLLAVSTELQDEHEKLSVLTHKHHELVLEQQQHKQQLEAMETSCRAVTAESLKHQTLANSALSQERLQLSTSLEAQVALARQQQDQLTKLQEQVSQLEVEKTQREEAASLEAALKLKQLQRRSSRSHFLDAETFAIFFFCLFVVVLSARFGFGPSWLIQ